MYNSPDNQHLLAIVTKIAKDLVAHYDQLSNYGGLYSSKIGLALFLADYTLHTQDKQFEEVIYQSVTDCLENIDPSQGLSLSGVAGIGWGINYLVSRGIFDKSEVEEYLSKLQHVVISSIDLPHEAQNHDLMHGFIGKVLFIIAQYHLGFASRETLVNVIRKSLQYLKETAIQSETGMAWKYTTHQHMEYSLGLSHGQPAIIVYLCEVLSLNLLSDEENQEVRTMIDHIAQWLMDKRTVNDEQKLLYPQSLYIDRDPHLFKRLAWCYGDPGMAIGFVNAGKTLKNDTYFQEGKALILQAAELPLEQSRIMVNPKNPSEIDMGFCHGVVGVLHMFHRFAQVFDDEVFHKSRTYWLNVMLQNTQPKAPYMGWKGTKAEDAATEDDGTSFRWVSKSTLLEGAAGMGMVLLHDFLMPPTQGLQWDHFFYTDLTNL
ncbi:MAG TPA: hypothetical protein DCS93_20815 [Microscillaceae bacterium]|nr:hypothetical protein [Microscillaceae bacterium]